MSVRFQADADLDFAILKGVRYREPALDFQSASEAGLRGVGDPEVLERAAAVNRVLVSHGRRTLLNHFRSRLAAGEFSPGLLIVSQLAPVGPVVESIIVSLVAIGFRRVARPGVLLALAHSACVLALTPRA